MEYTILLWPHANVRYRNEMHRLAEAELSILLARAVPGAEMMPGEDAAGIPAVSFACPEPLSEAQIGHLRGLSLLYGLFERGADGAMMPVAGRARAYLGEDLPGILKYKGKTNENFTQLLINAALYSSDFWNDSGALHLLDPMCGRGTTLFVGANRGWNTVGTDVDRGDLKQAEQFFKRYLEYHRFKHAVETGSRTIPGKGAASYVQFSFSDTPRRYKEGDRVALTLANADALDARRAFGAGAFHLIACDLPYGVQHASRGGTALDLLGRALPAWREALLPGGCAAVSFNAQTLPTESVLERMARAGMEPMRLEPYRRFSHWVEQAVTRDIAVCRRT